MQKSTFSENSFFVASNQKVVMPILLGLSTVLMFFVFSNYVKNNALIENLSSTLQNSPTPEPTQMAVPVASNKKTYDVTGVVTQALAFKSSLSTTLQSSLQLTYTTTLARKWSNLPCGSSCRNGVQFGDLSTTQLAAAQALIAMVLSSNSENGYEEFEAIRLAEDYLNANGGGSGYTSDLRWIAFLNTPSTSGTWMLQFGGHHYAANIAFNGEEVIGATPFFVALEPTSFTLNGTSYAPMEDEKTAFRSMLASLSTTQFNTAKLSTTFSDCLMSPGETNGNTNTMPSTKQGLQCSSLTATQKALVVAAMANYVNDMDAVTAASVLAKYEDEIDNTYIAFTGSATVGSASTFLSSNTNYVRIDGPSVWIEFACQTGVIFPSQIHYHSVWRDHDSDYGVDLTGDSIDNYLATDSFASNKSKVTVYPNPSSDVVSIDFGQNIEKAELTIVDINGKVVKTQAVSGRIADVNVSNLTKGNYVISVKNGNTKIVSQKFIKK